MNPLISNIIIIAILLIIVFFAVKGAIPHFKGEGSCCGGGSQKAVKPKKLSNVISTKVINIEGMTCEKCAMRIQNALNSIDGVSAKVSLRGKKATVKLGKDIPDTVLNKAITDLGYEVLS